MTARTLVDEVVGHLTYTDYWERSETVRLFERNYDATLCFEGEGDHLDEIQRRSYVVFREEEAALLGRVERGMFEYYERIAPEVRHRLGDAADELAPTVASVQDLGGLVTLRSVLFPVDSRSTGRSVCFLFDCTWDPELGVGVRVVDGEVEEIGTQDVAL